MKHYKKAKKLMKDYDLIEIVDYKKHKKFMENKVLRNPKTYTPLDFISEELELELSKKGIKDLTPYIPTLEENQEHFNFSIKLFLKLLKENPYDDFLKILAKNEEGNILINFTNWYEKYGKGNIKMEKIDLEKLTNLLNEDAKNYDDMSKKELKNCLKTLEKSHQQFKKDFKFDVPKIEKEVEKQKNEIQYLLDCMEEKSDLTENSDRGYEMDIDRSLFYKED